MEKLIREYIEKLIDWRETFPEGGWDEFTDAEFPLFVLHHVSDQIRLAGCGSIIEPIDGDVNVNQALDVLGKALERLTDSPTVGPYSVKQTARLLGISERLTYQLCNNGKLGCERHGRAIRISDEHIATYRNESERQPIKTGNFKHLD